MIGKCMNLKYRRKKGEIYCYCSFRRAVVDFKECNGCLNKEYKKVAKMTSKTPLKKINKNNKVRQATDIPKKVKLKVWKRDGGICIFCQKPVPWTCANSHYIKRSHLGMGIEEDIMTNCPDCHKLYEESEQRPLMKEYAKKHFMNKYDNWNEDMLVYRKWGN